MKTSQITTNQFLWWLTITASAVLLWIAAPEFVAFAAGLLALSTLMLMKREERTCNLSKRHIFTLILILGGAVALIVILKRTISEDHEMALTRFVQQPAFILPLWFVGVWINFRRWRSRNATAAS